MTRRNRLLLIALLAIIGALTVNFAVRAFDHGRQFRARPDEPIQPWMTIPYIAHARRVPPDAIQTALDLPAQPPDRRTLSEIAAAQGRSPEAAIAEVEAAVERARPPRPPGGGTPTPDAETPRRGP